MKMSTVCKDCGCKGKGVHHCEQYYNQMHSIAEYQRIEEELEAKVAELQSRIKKAIDILAEHQTTTAPTYLFNAIAVLKQEGV